MRVGAGEEGLARQAADIESLEHVAIQPDCVAAAAEIQYAVGGCCSKASVENKRVGTGAAEERIIAGATSKAIVATAANQAIVGRQTGDRIAAGAAGEPIVDRIAADPVVARPPIAFWMYPCLSPLNTWALAMQPRAKCVLG